MEKSNLQVSKAVSKAISKVFYSKGTVCEN